MFENQGWYIVPFEIKSNKKFENKMKAHKRVFDFSKCRYLFSYVTDLFNESDNAYVKTYTVNSNYAENLIFPHKRDMSDYDVSLKKITIVTFKNNIGMLIYNVNYNSMTINEIADFTNLFKKMGNQFENNDEQSTMIYGNLWEITQSVLPKDATTPFFYASKADNYECFVTMEVAGRFDDEESFSKTLSLLKNGMRSDVDTSDYKDMAVNVEIKEYPYLYFGASQNAFVALVDFNKANKSKNFLNQRFCASFESNYLCLYLILLNQRLMLLLSVYKSIENKDNIEQLKEIQHNLTQFKLLASFNIVSNTSNYQLIYDKIYSVLRIESLFKDVDEVNQKIMQDAESADIEREKKLNKILIVISVLAVFSALIDASDYFDRLFATGSESATKMHRLWIFSFNGPTAYALAFVAVPFLTLLLIFIIKRIIKKMKSNKNK